MLQAKKIFITGNAGAGKTTLSKELSTVLEIDCTGLDRIVWSKGWVKTPIELRKRLIADLIAKNTWIIDGVDYGVMEAADLVIFLDYPLEITYWRVLKRNLPYLFKSRPELPDNCPEILIIPYLIKLMWRFQQSVRPNILKEKEKRRKDSFVHIRTNADLRHFLASL